MLARRGGQLLAEDTVEFGTIEEPLTGAALGVGVQVELPGIAAAANSNQNEHGKIYDAVLRLVRGE